MWWVRTLLDFRVELNLQRSAKYAKRRRADMEIQRIKERRRKANKSNERKIYCIFYEISSYRNKFGNSPCTNEDDSATEKMERLLRKKKRIKVGIYLRLANRKIFRMLYYNPAGSTSTKEACGCNQISNENVNSQTSIYSCRFSHSEITQVPLLTTLFFSLHFCFFLQMIIHSCVFE